MRYDGAFIGVYHSPRKITNKTAYQTVASFIRGEYPDFDPEKLTLYRPHELKPPSTEEMLEAKKVGGFTRFDPNSTIEPIG